MRRTILGLSLVGMLLFGVLLALSFLHPLAIERAARELVRIEVERNTGARIDALDASRIAGLARRVLGRIGADADSTRTAIRAELPRRVAQVIANMLDADCACRLRLAAAADAGAQQHLRTLVQARERLTALIESGYARVSAQLLREFRIFSTANAAAFALLGAVTLARRRAGLQLLLPAAVLVGAIAVTGGLYLFRQDWLHAIVFNQYLGWAYAGWLAAVAALLADVLLNGARVTTRAINGLLHAVGSAATAVPC